MENLSCIINMESACPTSRKCIVSFPDTSEAVLLDSGVTAGLGAAEVV
jgi:hypothetical protein